MKNNPLQVVLAIITILAAVIFYATASFDTTSEMENHFEQDATGIYQAQEKSLSPSGFIRSTPQNLTEEMPEAVAFDTEFASIRIVDVDDLPLESWEMVFEDDAGRTETHSVNRDGDCVLPRNNGFYHCQLVCPDGQTVLTFSHFFDNGKSSKSFLRLPKMNSLDVSVTTGGGSPIAEATIVAYVKAGAIPEISLGSGIIARPKLYRAPTSSKDKYLFKYLFSEFATLKIEASGYATRGAEIPPDSNSMTVVLSELLPLKIIARNKESGERIAGAWVGSSATDLGKSLASPKWDGWLSTTTNIKGESEIQAEFGSTQLIFFGRAEGFSPVVHRAFFDSMDREVILNFEKGHHINGWALSSDGIGVAGLLVRINLESNNSSWEENESLEVCNLNTCTTDEDGFFSFTDIFEGNYSIEILDFHGTLASHANVDSYWAKTVANSGSEGITVLENSGFEGLHTLEIEILEADGRYLNDSNILVKLSSKPFFDEKGVPHIERARRRPRLTEGTLVVSNIPFEPFKVSLKISDRSASLLTLESINKKKIKATFEASVAGDLNLRFLNSEGATLTASSLRLRPINQKREMFEQHYWITQDGSSRISSIIPGTYQIVIGGHNTEQNITFYESDFSNERQTVVRLQLPLPLK